MFIGCKDNQRIAIENELDQIENDLYFYPQKAEIKLDSINKNLSPQMKDKFDGQLAFLSGLLEYKKGNIDSSLAFLDKSLTRSLYQDNVKTQAKSQMVLGWIAEGTNYWEQAISNYYTCIQLLDGAFVKETGLAYIGIFRCKRNLREEGDNELQKGIRILNNTQKTEYLLYAEYMESIANQDAPDTPERLKAIAQKYAQLGLTDKEASVYKSLASNYKNKNQIDSALLYVNKAIVSEKNKTSGISLMPALVNFKGLLLYKQKKYEQAKIYLNKSLTLYNINNQSEKKYYSYDILHNIANHQEDYKAAYFYLKKSQEYYKITRTNNKQYLSKITETTMNVNFLKGEINQLKSRRNINTLIFMCIMLLLLLVIIILSFRYKTKHQREQAQKRELQNLLVGLGEKKLLTKHLGMLNDELMKNTKININLSTSFEICYTETISHFKQQFKQLSKTEVRYAVMFAMYLSDETIVKINNIKLDSLRKTKLRIKTKVCQEEPCNVKQYFSQFIA